MNRHLGEESVLIASIIKWFVLATIVGVLVGISTAFFIHTLNFTIAFAITHRWYFLAMPIGLWLSAWMVSKFAPDATGHGTEKVIEAVHKHHGHIRASVIPIKLLATITTLATGGSAGKEGPCAQIGGGMASLFAWAFRFNDDDHKKLVICGISAGFAAVFGTPIAGAIFAIEVLFAGSMMYEVLLPSFVAGIIGFQVASSLGVSYFYHPIEFIPGFTETFFVKVALSGIFFGLCAFFLIEILHRGESFFKKLNMSVTQKAFFAGTVLMLLSFVVSTHYLGLGLDTIESTLDGGSVPWYAFIIKAFYTSVTLSGGGSGGIVTPIFFIGSTSGAAFASWFNLDTATFAAIGLVSVLAGATNTPLAASILAVELFGPKIAPYASIACVISFITTGHRSVYPSQVLAFRKSPSIKVEVGKEMEDLHPEAEVDEEILSRAARFVKFLYSPVPFMRRRPPPPEPESDDTEKEEKST